MSRRAIKNFQVQLELNQKSKRENSERGSYQLFSYLVEIATESLVIRQDHGPTHVRLRAGEISSFLLEAEAPGILKILWLNPDFYSRVLRTK